MWQVSAEFNPVFRAWAMRYVEKHSWHVFALQPREKVPATAHGWKDAVVDVDAVRAMWGERECNVGLACGPLSGVFVLDVDATPPKSGGIAGPAALAILEERNGALPPTLRVSTGGDGWHLYFRWPKGRPLRNRARIKIDGQQTGLDVRAEGGYVVLPPSIHPSGGTYRWDKERTELHDAPAWLLDLLDPPKVEAPKLQATLPMSQSDLDTYGRKALKNAVERIHASAEGDRHGAIFREAAGMGELVAGGSLDAAVAESALVAAGIAIGKPRAEVERTVRDGMKQGSTQPRTPQPRPAPGTAPAPNGGAYRASDAGNAARMADRFGFDVRWSEGVQGDGWLVWDGARWAPDTMRVLDEHALGVAQEVVAHAAAVGQQLRDVQARASSPPTAAESAVIAQIRTEAKLWDRWARDSEMVGHVKAMQTLARRAVAVDQERLDADLWALNTPGGVVRLTSGQLEPHDREALHTKITGAAPQGDCPTWTAFLTRIMGNDPDMVAFLQRVVGYCMTGSTREQCIFILYGNGSNGKSTFLDTIRSVLGDYVKHARAETFMRDSRGGGIPNDIAALRGARVVTASEPSQGERLDESLVKEMTGDAAITARFMRGEFFTFTPQFKVLLATNHRPVIRGTDHGIWRRIRLVPFTEKIADEEKDRELGNKLQREADGILAWAVAGCLAWQREGLNPPAAVIEATEDYRADMDILAEFLAERCVVGVQTVNNTQLYKAFKEWSEDNGEKPRSQKWLYRELTDRGFKQASSRKYGRAWEGLGLREDALPDVKTKGRW
jgi:putative DNA primase/helicase